MPEQVSDERGGDELGRELDDQAADVEGREDKVDQVDPVTHAEAPPTILLGQRVLFVGDTGTGKSEGLLGLFAEHTGQRILIDVQDHYLLGPDALAEDPPPLELDDPAKIDWRHRTIRYVPRRAGDRREMDRLHAAIYRRGRVFVACDEAEDVAPSQGGGSPPFVRKCLKQGRKVRLTYGAATQRPVGVDRSVINQAEHAFLFRMSDGDDLKVISYRLGMSVNELAAALNRLGKFEYLRHTKGHTDERGRPIVLHMPPLPAEVIDRTRRQVVNLEHRESPDNR
jgi:hypothetical protein